MRDLDGGHRNDGEHGQYRGNQDGFGCGATECLAVKRGKPGFNAVTQEAHHNDGKEDGKKAGTHEKGEEILLDMENKLQLASRFTKMREKSSEIASELESINSNINNDEISSKIHSLIKQIQEMANY